MEKGSKKKLYKLLIMSALVWVASGLFAFAEDVSYDKSGLDKGLIKISAKVDAAKLKLMIQKDTEKYVYDLKNDGKVETFPLQLGNGDYKLTVLKHVVDSKYAPISSETVTLALKDSNTVFLQSVQNINWGMDSQAVKKATQLIQGFKDGTVKLEKVYAFVIANYRYDYDKAAKVQPGYVPVVDSTFTTKKGICYDYSSMFAAMLRSHGIPTRLVKGYTKNVEGYHAWNEVYDAKNKKWIVIDTTYDAVMFAAKKKTTLKKEVKDYQNVNIY